MKSERIKLFQRSSFLGSKSSGLQTGRGFSLKSKKVDEAKVYSERYSEESESHNMALLW
jgi:hypothetical protein